jgi:putative addiction module killer protein
MYRIEQTSLFRQWLGKLKNPVARAAIVLRLDRVALGQLGDVKPVGKGVWEMRMHVGAGYRLYYHLQGQHLVLLLAGGDKGSQQRDIAQAQQLLKGIDHES